MLVTSLEYMSEIVSKREDLEWHGWDVIKYTKSSSAMFSPDGVLKNGIWCKRKIFSLTESGWQIPNSIGRLDAELER
jgi:hypothetical protein